MIRMRIWVNIYTSNSLLKICCLMSLLNDLYMTVSRYVERSFDNALLNICPFIPLSTLEAKCKEVVRNLISDVYNVTDNIDKVYDLSWDLELHCFLNSDKYQLLIHFWRRLGLLDLVGSSVVRFKRKKKKKKMGLLPTSR